MASLVRWFRQLRVKVAGDFIAIWGLPKISDGEARANRQGEDLLGF